jgi:hypothetical protein
MFIIYVYSSYNKKRDPGCHQDLNVQQSCLKCSGQFRIEVILLTLWRCRVGYFFLFEEIPIAITATISVAKLTIKFIASYVTISGTPFPILDWRRPLPTLLICCTKKLYHIDLFKPILRKHPFVFLKG